MALKRILWLVILLASTGVASAAITNTPITLREYVTLTSDYPTNELSTNLWFKVYTSTNLMLALTNWPLHAIVPGTNATFRLPFDEQVVQRFYVAKASNSWWRIESDFSNVAWTPPPPRDLINLRLDLDAP